jgi:alpha-glucosidase
LTGRNDFSRLHDEPSRLVRVFPARTAATATFALYEDDGVSFRYRDGDYAEVVFDLRTTATDIMLSARVTGSHALPYRQIDVELPPDERRRLSLTGAGVELAVAASRND